MSDEKKENLGEVIKQQKKPIQTEGYVPSSLPKQPKKTEKK